MRKTVAVFILFFVFTFNLFAGYRIYKLEVENGEIIFALDHEKAKSVSIAGSFNEWTKDAWKMKKDEMGIWVYRAKLKPGKYEYKFVINGKEWIPEENLRFTLSFTNNKLIITEGGKEIFAPFDKRCNTFLSDKIFFKGFLNLEYIPYYSFNYKKFSGYKFHTFFVLQPDIYIHRNVFLKSEFILDSFYTTAYNLSLFGLWRAQIIINPGWFYARIFHNYKSFFFLDPLHSIVKFIYTSGYPLFKYPVTFYDNPVPEYKFGINYKGIYFQTSDTGITDLGLQLKCFIMTPLYYYEEVDESGEVTESGSEVISREIHQYPVNYKYYFNLAGIEIKKTFSHLSIAFINLLKAGKYLNEYYMEPDSSGWVYLSFKNPSYKLSFTPSDTKYFSRDYYIFRTGGVVKFLVLKRLSIFGEYLTKKKTGGFFVKSFMSNGYDLPYNYLLYGYQYEKKEYFYESPFTGEEFAAGVQYQLKNINFELTVTRDKKIFQQIDDIISTDKDSSKLAFSFKSFGNLKIKDTTLKFNSEVRGINANPDVEGLNYEILFDENNFYNVYSPECYRKITLRGNLFISSIIPVQIRIKYWYNKYFQRDIYFETEKEWSSETFENFVEFNYPVKKANIRLGSRIKSYFYKRLITSADFWSYKNTFVNPYIYYERKILGGRGFVKVGTGIEPDVNEYILSGYPYQLMEYLNFSEFPFFKSAEKNLANNLYFKISGGIKF